MRYLAGAFLNETEGPNRFRSYEQGDPLRRVGPLFHIEGATVEDALEQLWAVGNIGATDAEGRTWPRERSLCEGDVVIVSGHGRWTPGVIGWQRVPEVR